MSKISIQRQIESVDWVINRLGIVFVSLKTQGSMPVAEADGLLEGLDSARKTLAFLQRNEEAIKQALSGNAPRAP